LNILLLTPCGLDNNSAKRINVKGWGGGGGWKSTGVWARSEEKKKRGKENKKERM
jgi:hypothetical protein